MTAAEAWTEQIELDTLTPAERDEVQLAYLRCWLGTKRREAFRARGALAHRVAEGPRNESGVRVRRFQMDGREVTT